MVKTISTPTLEESIGKEVEVHIRTLDGDFSRRGLLLSAKVPWAVELATEGREDSNHISSIKFAGPAQAITDIWTVDDKLLYTMNDLPSIYITYNLADRDEFDALNDLRRNIFGEGFDYKW